MLGRRAVVTAIVCVSAVTGGGVALAANHTSSSSKPSNTAPRHYMAPQSGKAGQGNCPNMGTNSSSNASNSL